VADFRVYKTHIRQTRGVKLKLCATRRPLFEDNISVADCMPLSSLLKTTLQVKQTELFLSEQTENNCDQVYLVAVNFCLQQ